MTHIDLTGQRFSKLVALRVVGKDKSGTNRWECSCDCGAITVISSSQLRRGTKSCGCIQFKDITDRVFGYLTVLHVSKRIAEHPNKGMTSFWLCRCKCGNKKEIRINSLMAGKIRSCGCLQKEITRKRTSKAYEKITGAYWSLLQRNASKSNRIFEITKEYIWSLYQKQDGKCALSNIPIIFAPKKYNTQTASLDRIDSNLGYIKGNVQWVHKRVNSLKSNFPEKELLIWCRLITQTADLHGKNISLDSLSLSQDEA